jgi:hypothetical protein
MLTGRDDSHLVGHKSFKLEEKTLKSFLMLQEDLSSYDINLDIISAYRGFDRQLAIWNEKAEGKRDLYSKDHQLLDYSSLSEEQILEAILNWSAIPGASRHHWGSDIDVFDSNIKPKAQTDLNNIEYTTDFKELTKALDSKIQSNNSYSFFRPYSLDKGGVSKELWHLSHKDSSDQFFSNYTLEVFIKNIEKSDMLLKNLILQNAKNIYKNYILNISY